MNETANTTCTGSCTGADCEHKRSRNDIEARVKQEVDYLRSFTKGASMSPQEWSAWLMAECRDGLQIIRRLGGTQRDYQLRDLLRKIAGIAVTIIDVEIGAETQVVGEPDASNMRAIDYCFPIGLPTDQPAPGAVTWVLLFPPALAPRSITDWMIHIESAVADSHSVLMSTQDFPTWSKLVRTIALATGTAMLSFGVEDRYFDFGGYVDSTQKYNLVDLRFDEPLTVEVTLPRGEGILIRGPVDHLVAEPGGMLWGSMDDGSNYFFVGPGFWAGYSTFKQVDSLPETPATTK